MAAPDTDRAHRLIPRDPDAFEAFVAALVKGARARRRGPRPRTRPTGARPTKAEVLRGGRNLTRKRPA